MSNEVQRAYERAVEQLLSDETVLGALPEDQIQPVLDGAIARLERAAADAENSDAFAAAFDAIRSGLRAEVMAAAEGGSEPVTAEAAVAEAPPPVAEPQAAPVEPPPEPEPAPSEPSVLVAGWDDTDAHTVVEPGAYEPDIYAAFEPATGADHGPDEAVAGSATIEATAPEPPTVAGAEPAPEVVAPPPAMAAGDAADGIDAGAEMDAARPPEEVAEAVSAETPATAPEDAGLVEETREALNRFGARLRGLFGRGDDA